MTRKNSAVRRISRWLLWLLAVFALLVAFQVTLLAFPQIFLSSKVQVGSVVIYHDADSDQEIQKLTANVSERIEGSGFGNSTRIYHVYYFSSADKYEWFAHLAMLTTKPQGFNLSFLGNSYVCGPRVMELATRTGGTPKFGLWEGDPAHIIAHEIAHQIVTDRIGRGLWSAIPHWKQEGLPEYIANIATIRKDSLATIPGRFAILNDNRIWGYERRWDRIHYEAELLVEYLIDVKGYEIEDIVSDSVTWEETMASLSDWCEKKSGSL